MAAGVAAATSEYSKFATLRRKSREYLAAKANAKLFDAFRSANYKECFGLLPDFAFLPIRPEQVSKYASDAGTLHIAVKEKLPQIVRIAGIAISEVMQERRAVQRTPAAATMISSSSQELKTRLHSLALYAGYVKIIPENVATELSLILNGI